MSVLIEAECLVVSRLAIELGYPGGLDAFLEFALSAEGTRFAIADDDLVSVSSFGGSELMPIVEALVESGLLMEERSGDAFDLVIVGQETGPTLRAEWLTFERHRHGFSHAWDSRKGAQGALVAPDGWRLESSWRLVRTDEREESSDWLHLATENGHETWLDFRTGSQNKTVTEVSKVVKIDADDTIGARSGSNAEATPSPVKSLGRCAALLHRVLMQAGIPYRVDLEHGCVVVPFATDMIDRIQVMAIPASDETVHFAGVLPDRYDSVSMSLIHRFADAIASWNCGLAVVADDDTCSVHVATSIAGVVGVDKLMRLERALCAAADRAGDVATAMNAFLRGDASLSECVLLVASGRE